MGAVQRHSIHKVRPEEAEALVRPLFISQHMILRTKVDSMKTAILRIALGGLVQLGGQRGNGKSRKQKKSLRYGAVAVVFGKLRLGGRQASRAGTTQSFPWIVWQISFPSTWTHTQPAR